MRLEQLHTSTTGDNGKDNTKREYTVWLTDDDPNIHSFVRMYLETQLMFLCTKQFFSCEELLAVLEEEEPPDILLLDLEFRGSMSGIEIFSSLQQRFPQMKIIPVTGHYEGPVVVTLVHRGINVYVCKPFEEIELLKALRAAVNGETYFDKISTKSLQTMQIDYFTVKEQYKLSDPEHELLLSLAEGKTEHEIANERHRAPDTVHHQITALYKKLGVHSKVQVVIKFFKEGLWLVLKSEAKKKKK